MLNKNNSFVILGIIILFSIGLIGFFTFSAPYGDGLEKTMELAGIEESEPVYNAPLSYGENYPIAFSMGCIGLAASLLCIYLFGKVLREKRATRNN